MRTTRSRTRVLPHLAMLVALAACVPAGARHAAPHGGTTDDATPHRTGTSSDAHVDRDDSNQAYGRIEDLIEGRAPGVRVLHHQDGTIRLQIRGITSPAGHNDPLVVIDGVPTTELHPGTALSSINPSDVVRIDVLKDAASTAFYGMRGANGVIVITTRQQ